MAEDVNVPNKKNGLRPIPARRNEEDGDTEVRPIKRKPKKKATDANRDVPSPTSNEDKENENKPVSRQRRKRSPSRGKDGEEEVIPASQPGTATPRKKRKPKADATETGSSQILDGQEQQENQGSKASLIQTTETPRKKAGKKKKKKVKKTTMGDVDDFGESPWAEDLRTMKEDIITGVGGKEGEAGTGDKGDNKKPPTILTTAPVLRSQPLDRIFVETSRRFKGQKKSTVMRQKVEDAIPTEPEPVKKSTTIDFAVSTHRVFQVVVLFLHGLTAGLALWQMVMVLTLSTFSSDDFLEHYYRVSLPLQSWYYFLLVMCTVSFCDRCDIGNPTPKFILQALTLQNGAVSIVLCLVALILDLVAIRYDDRMYLFKEFTDLYSDNNMKADDINTFKGITVARTVLIILSWLVLSITPNSDRLGKSLKSGETGLERDHELEKVSTA